MAETSRFLREFPTLRAGASVSVSVSFCLCLCLSLSMSLSLSLCVSPPPPPSDMSVQSATFKSLKFKWIHSLFHDRCDETLEWILDSGPCLTTQTRRSAVHVWLHSNKTRDRYNQVWHFYLLQRDEEVAIILLHWNTRLVWVLGVSEDSQKRLWSLCPVIRKLSNGCIIMKTTTFCPGSLR